jgi:acetyl esterase/lipase
MAGQASPARTDTFTDTSPAAMRSSAWRQVSIHATHDRIAPVAVGEAYTAKAKARGERAELRIVADAGHFELITPGTPAWDAIAAEILKLVG